MWQTASQILADDQDRTTLSLIYANISLDDILIKDLLDHLAAKYPSRSALVRQESPTLLQLAVLLSPFTVSLVIRRAIPYHLSRLNLLLKHFVRRS